MAITRACQAGLVPLQRLPQATIARRSAQGGESAEEFIVEIIVAAGVAQRALSGVGQRGEEFSLLRMPGGLRPGQG